MSRNRYTHRAHQMRSMPAAYPLVIRQGMRPVGYGYGLTGEDDKKYKAVANAAPATQPAEGWDCIYIGGKNDVSAVKMAGWRFVEKGSVADPWWDAPAADGGATDTDKDALRMLLVTGEYTPAAKAAVLSFQKYAKYDYVDGVIGPETWRKFNKGDKGVNCPTPASSYVPSGGGAGGKGGKNRVDNLGPGGSGESITDKAWFWPVAILVPTAAVIGGILFWPKKKKATQ